MIENYGTERTVNITGDTSRIEFHIWAEGIGAGDAIAANEAFDHFIHRISLNEIPRDLPTKKDSTPVAVPVKISHKKKIVEPVTSVTEEREEITPSGKWLHTEIAAIDKCPDVTTAIARYHKKFPDSKRSDWAIEQRWFMVTRKERGVVPGAKAKNGVIVQPAAENVVKRSSASSKKTGKKSGHPIACPYCKNEFNSHILHLHVMHAHPEKYQEHITQKKGTSPSSASDKILIATGMYVRQIKAEKGEKLLGELKVLKIDGDQIKVRNGNKKPHIISRDCLELVPVKKKTPKERGLTTKERAHREESAPADKEATRLDADAIKRAGAFLTPAEEPILRDEPDADPELGPPVGEVVKEPFQETPETPETEATAIPSSPAPTGGLTRGKKVRHNGAESDPHYGQIGTIERYPQQLSECLVSFKQSSSWVKKTDLVLVEAT